MFIRNESFYSFRRSYPVVTTLVAIHLILFLWMNLLPGGGSILALGIGDNYAVANGEYWRLITPIFLHIGLGHVVFNSFSLVIFGPALERMLGKWKFLLIYLLSGIIANIATYYLGGLSYYHLGASGAIFGLFGIYLYMILNRKDLIDQANSQLVMIILVIGLVMTFVNSNINILAHLFGLIGGAALAPIILAGAHPYHAYQHVYDEQEVTFNPNRWRRRQINPRVFGRVFWILLIGLVLVGFLTQLF
ncbi:rhomboid family intramembrane serine protease [Halalkalibacterium ligniniphilum]|uniref:rhomboid family intramembrane serine protease n=1 Tax=Halalkalibacterium ligniniphilum TaxID=1134413 RepID=UPI00034C0B3E|nr:rhomboid family intramembrane serine protease [Halalkalibacterium ligniniphilum]